MQPFWSLDSVKNIDGKPFDLKETQGKVVLCVNVASFCGLTKNNYPFLNELQRKFSDLVIIGFPCSQFGHQEIAANHEILNVLKYVRPGNGFAPEFPLTQKVLVNGPDTHPVWAWLKKAAPETTELPGYAYLPHLRSKELAATLCVGSDIQWNFAKFLVHKDGVTVQRFSPHALEELEAEIKAALEK
eukprot:TRINITY_DN14774_c0_g1_i1.p1 TRINITY_DN14774_c0_g1~~TRINITY_DN14774_c0_g1_i1.p1  ORF type:complete len:187 (+),score=35.96 TRINITY_DN14774_c0_g1_i1:31-591(+)